MPLAPWFKAFISFFIGMESSCTVHGYTCTIVQNLAPRFKAIVFFLHHGSKACTMVQGHSVLLAPRFKVIVAFFFGCLAQNLALTLA
jgi:hypothetical protein